MAEDLPDVVTKETVPTSADITPGPTPTKVSATAQTPKKPPGIVTCLKG